GFEIHPDKIQRECPFKYLRLKIEGRTVAPQPVVIRDNPRTLNDLQQLCRTINWIRPWLGISTEDLAPLFNLLRGEDGLSSPRHLTPEAREALGKVQEALSSCQAHRVNPELSFQLCILDGAFRDPLLLIEWVLLPHNPSKTITRPQELMAQLVRKARSRLRTLASCRFACIYLPLRSEKLEFLLQTSEALQYALDSFSGKLSLHYPSHKLFFERFKLAPKIVKSPKPLNALTVFTDGSGASHKSVMTWRDPLTSQWEEDVQVVEGSPQIAELAAVVRAFQRFSDQPLNIVSDSAYVTGVVDRAEHAQLKEVSNPNLYTLLSELIKLLSHREQPYYIMHVRSHTDLPGPICEGNRRADALAAPLVALVTTPSVPDTFQKAKLSHQLYHQNAPALVRMFQLTCDQARSIVATCPNCSKHQVPSLGMGVNPRGLQSCQLWQTDVTHVPEFGRLKFVHVSIDTFSGAVFASTHTGEK
ncbi:POK11 protein, partial [Melanocharis versteri]|nr:POK11 protein [Melanocharis versteri]